MKIGPKARKLIASFEGNVLEAYPDPATGGEPWTIGRGFTLPGKIKQGDTIPAWCSEVLFDCTLRQYEDAVRDHLDGADTDAAQFGALVSLSYNIGIGALARSTLLRKHKTGDWDGAEAEFARWNRAAGKVMPGLTRRRKAEAELYRLYR